jgi:AcrR family transcriptional regulator
MYDSSVDKEEKVVPELQPRKIPAQKRAEKTVNHILDTSAKLLDEVGFDRFNTNLLAERANVRIATVYRYFPNKLSILSELIHRWLGLLKENMSFWEDFADPSKDWREIVCETLDIYHNLAQGQPGFTSIRRAMQSVPELQSMELDLVVELSQLTLEGLIARGVSFPKRRLFTAAGTWMMTTASGYDLIWLAATRDNSYEAEILEELKLNATSYLANYLD